MNKKTIVLKSHFDSAHRLLWHQGKCFNLHGHTYIVQVTFKGELNENGVIEDFAILKNILEIVSDFYDHKYLNDLLPNPTVENLANDYWCRLEKRLYPSVKLVKLRISEGLNNWTELEL